MTVAHPASRIGGDLADLRAGAARWAAMRPQAKAELLERVTDRVALAAARWAEAGARAKGIAGTPLAGEEWISGPWALLYALNRYIATLRRLDQDPTQRSASPRLQLRPDGQLVAHVFPVSAYDRVLLSGVRADVWMAPGVTPDSLAGSTARWYAQTEHRPRVALVLGAGNISSIAPLDVLYELVAHGATCMLKMNPVNDYLGPIFEDALAPLVDGGYLRFAYGGADVGKYLCEHDAIDEIHITGSHVTYDAIVFGTGDDGARRKLRNDPVLKKPITSELGNVSPTIVVPGPWTDADFVFQAQNIVTQKMHNGGFNCIAAQVLVMPADWDGTPKLLAAIDDLFARMDDRPAYYPGAASRVERLRGVGNDAKAWGRATDAFVARTRVEVDAERVDDPAFHDEAFGSALVVTRLPGEVDAYLERATAFSNDVLWGSLGANLIVHPATMRRHAQSVDRAIASLRYGCVAVNAWTGVGFFICESTWGAFPGHTRDDIQSGNGVVHNSNLFEAAQKSVVYAPFAPFPRCFMGYGATLLPRPPWFVTNRMAERIGRALCEFEHRKTPLTMARVALLAMRG